MDSSSHVVATGYNGVPTHFPHCLDEPCEGASAPSGYVLEKCLAVHAEQNAIGYAARNGIQTEGCIIYCTQSPCISCAKLIVASGINIFFYLEDYRLRDGLDFLMAANVQTLKITK